jgi:hypothetical protein
MCKIVEEGQGRGESQEHFKDAPETEAYNACVDIEPRIIFAN